MPAARGENPHAFAVQLAARHAFELAGHWVASVHATHCPLPVQRGVAASHATGVYDWPSAAHTPLVDVFWQIVAPATQTSHCPPTASQILLAAAQSATNV